MENAMSPTSRIARLALLLPLCCIATGAAAIAQRTFVASGGSDANPCTLASPCRSFGAAIAQTSSGGEVIVLDSAGYGPVVITQAVSIIAPTGVYAGVSVFTGAGLLAGAVGTSATYMSLINSLVTGNTTGVPMHHANDLVDHLRRPVHQSVQPGACRVEAEEEGDLLPEVVFDRARQGPIQERRRLRRDWRH
jgi:hypothetical protein